MNICIIGTSGVGLVSGVCFAELGVTVTCVDRDVARVAALAEGRVPIHEPRLGELLRRNLAEGRLRFTNDLEAAVRGALVVFIAVGTPSRSDGTADLDDVEEAARAIGRALDGYKVVVTKSTVPVGTARRVAHIVRAAVNGHGAGAFDVASNPEFLREGSAVEDFLRPNRVVIGADSAQAVAILQDLYRPLYLIETPIVVTSMETAELIRYAANAFLAMKVSFVNELANLCEVVGVDVHAVAKTMGLDHRIGPKFLHPGPGFGGSCFLKDVRALSAMARSRGCRLQLVDTVMAVNEYQNARMVDKIAAALGAAPSERLDGVRIGALGLAFKPNTDDVRETPALHILGELRQRGATVCAYDPAAIDGARRLRPDFAYCDDAYAAAVDADALIVFTAWNEFRNLDLTRVKTLMQRPLLIDLGNAWDPVKAAALGFQYDAVGRTAPRERRRRGARPLASTGRPS